MWIESGEMSTRYFKELETIQGRQRLIKDIETENGEIASNKEQILVQTAIYYEALFAASPTNESVQKQFIRNVRTKVPETERLQCEEPIDMTELTEAMKQLKPCKAPETDGLPVEFFL